MVTYRLTFIRHGRTLANDGMAYIGGRTDLGLSDKGREELREMAKLEYPKVQRVYSSPLSRCTETAEILFPNKEVGIVEGLREMDLGEFEGKNFAELYEREDYQKWLRGDQTVSPPGGESVQEVMARAYLAIDAMLRDMMANGLTSCAVITHAGIMQNILSGFGLPKLRPMDFACDFGEGFEVLINLSLWQRGQCFEIVGMVPWSQTEEEYDPDNDDYDIDYDVHNDYHGEFDFRV